MVLIKEEDSNSEQNLQVIDVAQDIKVSQLGYTASLQRRTEQGNVTASGAGAKAVTFTNPFFVGTSSLLGANTNLPLCWYQCSEHGIRRLL